jgi:hypothetical protein
MDQIRKVLAWLKQYHFWVLSVLIAIIALACWKMGAATLAKELATNQSTITSGFKSLKDLRDKPFHPNQEINDKQLKQIELQANNVATIWKSLYDRQSKRVLTWPPELSPEFREFVTTHKFGDDIPNHLRANFRDYISGHFESLPKRINARVMDESELGGAPGEFSRGTTRGMFRGEGGPMTRGDETGGQGALIGQDEDYICEWLDQGMVRMELDFPTSPSSMKIWVTQENLWVYYTLLDIIANTNTAAGADRKANAAVKEIISMQIGQPAAMASLARGRVEILQAPAAGGAEIIPGEGGGLEGGERGPEGGTEFAGPAYGERSGEGGVGGAMSEAEEKAALLAGRYLDAAGNPSGMAPAAAAVEGGDPSLAAPAAEVPAGPFKRLPIRMVLKMDQRWLTHLISECASQPLPVEVTQVRVNPPGLEGTIGGGGGEGSYRGMGGDGSGGGSRSAYQPPYSGAVSTLAFRQHPELATVDIQGIVTIFNEPDPTQLQVDAGEQQVVSTE